MRLTPDMSPDILAARPVANPSRPPAAPPEPPIINRQGFTFQNGRFLFEGEPRASATILKRLIIPDECRLPNKERQYWSKKADRVLKVPFLVAQLKHYDLYYPYPPTFNVLWNILRSSVKFGKVSSSTISTPVPADQSGGNPVVVSEIKLTFSLLISATESLPGSPNWSVR